MITDEEIQKIFDWADKNDINNKGVVKENLGNEVLSWRKGIPRKKNNILDTEYFELDFWGYKNITIPNEFFKLPNLKGLAISLKAYNKIDRKNLQKITFLKIYIGDVSKKEVIKFIDNLDTSIELEYLYIYSANLEKVPESIFTLSNLKYLKLEHWNKLIEVSSDIKKLNKLEALSLAGCSLLKKIPNEIGSLTKLRDLDLRWSNIKKLPDEFSNLVNLEQFNGESYIIIKKENETIQIPNINLSNKQLFSNYKIGNLTFPHKNLLLKGVPGTGKSRAIENIINNKLNLKNHKENILRVNIHSASSNADLMQGIGISSKDGQIEYKEKQGLILNLIERATFHPNQPFVLILEEIQENSLNELIGDLIYLIEDDKRAKDIVADNKEYNYQELVEKIIADNPQTAYVEIPYLVNDSTKYRKMIMPNNLYIFCTSNYRDDKKVIEDNLLRRFEVLEIYPKYKRTIGDAFKNQSVSDFLERLNSNILDVMKDEIHPDRFLIGHSNWLNVDDEEKFYRAFLKVVVEFKDIKEIEFDDFKKLIDKDTITLPEWISIGKYNSYKDLIEDLQIKAGYDFLD